MIGILITMLNLINTAVIVYCIMTFVIPDSSLTNTIRPYADMVLDPFRKLLYKVFPGAANMSVDFSPLLLYLVIRVLTALLSVFG